MAAVACAATSASTRSGSAWSSTARCSRRSRSSWRRCRSRAGPSCSGSRPRPSRRSRCTGRAATTREPGAQPPLFSLPPRCRLGLLLGLPAAGSLSCVTRTALAANSLNPPRFDADVVLYNAVSCGPSPGCRAHCVLAKQPADAGGRQDHGRGEQAGREDRNRGPVQLCAGQVRRGGL